MSTANFAATADLLLLYPQQSLADQMNLWAGRHPERRVEVSFERSLPKIRRRLWSAGGAIVDATGDPAMAVDAFLQAVAHLGPKAVAVYTEAAHDGLELFVRTRGALFLFGPMFGGQWEEFFDRWLQAEELAPVALGSRPRRALSLHAGGRGRWHTVNRIRARFDWQHGDF